MKIKILPTAHRDYLLEELFNTIQTVERETDSHYYFNVSIRVICVPVQFNVRKEHAEIIEEGDSNAA